MAFMPSIACEIITINSGTTYPNRLQKYTKGLTLSTSMDAKIRLLFETAKFIFSLQQYIHVFPQKVVLCEWLQPPQNL